MDEKKLTHDDFDDVRKDLDRLKIDMDAFRRIYETDDGCWKGEAAVEEHCYVSADIDEFMTAVDDLESLLERTEENAGTDR